MGTQRSAKSVTICSILVDKLMAFRLRHLICRGLAIAPIALREYPVATGEH